MLGHIFLSASAFKRLLKLRVLGELRTSDDPRTIEGKPCYLDGMEFTNLFLYQSEAHQTTFRLNDIVQAGTRVGPIGYEFPVQTIRARVAGHLFYVSVQDMEAASAVGPAGRFGLPTRISVPIPNIEVDITLTVTDQGMPSLNVLSDNPDLVAEMPSLGHMTIPMPMDTAFGEMLEPGKTRVLNAGIMLTGGENVVMRFEFESVYAGYIPKRLTDWGAFFNGDYPSQLDTPTRDWAIEMETRQILAKASAELDDSMNSKGIKKYITPTQKAWGEWHAGTPSFMLHKRCVFESLCSGLDVKGELLSKVTLSVPADNTLRQSVDLKIDVDNWDAWKCMGISLLNPLAGLITVFDNSEDIPWYLEIAGSLIWFWPALAVIGWGVGLDDVATRFVIKEAQKEAKEDRPAIIRTSMSSFYTESSKSVTTSLTRDWLVLEDVGAVGDRLVLRGRYAQPDVNTLPRLVGTLLDPFEFWTKKDRCASYPTYITTATVGLTLEEPDKTVVQPIVPVRYGRHFRIENDKKIEEGEVTWRVVKDAAHAYEYPRANVHWTGIPGTFEVELNSPPQIVSPSVGIVTLPPKPMHVQFFTNYGVRELEIPPPPRPPKRTPEQAKIDALQRANDCYIFDTLIARVKALQVFWLPTPRPDFRVAQHWQVILGGLAPGMRIRAWNADSGEILADVESIGRITELSLVIPPEQSVRSLQVTLDDQPLMSRAAYLRHASRLTARRTPAQTWTLIRQTPLIHASTIALRQPAESLALERDAGSLSILAAGSGLESSIDVELETPSRFFVRTLDAAVGSSNHMANRGNDDGAVTVEADFGPKEIHAPGRYFVRPWFDRGDALGHYFARLSEDGSEIELFARGMTREAWPDIGRPIDENFPAVDVQDATSA